MLIPMTRSRGRLGWIAWAVGLGLVLVALGWQVRYVEEVLACSSSDRLVLCSGPLVSWLMPMTVLIGLALVAIASWRLTVTRR
jgi:hypothetical protein